MKKLLTKWFYKIQARFLCITSPEWHRWVMEKKEWIDDNHWKITMRCSKCGKRDIFSSDK